ncbi:MAG: glycosyltransferase [Janthinobacterium lividum]
MRILVVVGLIVVAHFVWWFANPEHIGYPPLFWLLTFSLGYKIVRMLHEWYHYVQVREPLLPLVPATAPLRQVDMLTTACPGEPHAMIIRTLEALVAVRYPHKTYLCDEGDEEELRAACARLGVIHVTRTEKKHAKAGNINNALRQATGELCVVLDPDHEVTPDFLDQVVPYFEDPTVGYVQVVQSYGNQKESLVALGAAEQTYHFYGPLMMGMNAYNTVQAIGANCTFRREALDEIGGHAAGLTEDMHTAMRLHAAGWKSVYAPVVVSRGLVPSTLGAYYMQQLKWARGTFDLLLHVYPKLFKKFTWRQRLHYAVVSLYFLSGLIALIDLGVPIVSLLIFKFAWHLSLPEFALHMVPVTAVGLLIRYHAQRWLREPHEVGLHLTGGTLRIATWWIYTLGLVYTLLNIKVPYLPTPKEGNRKNEWLLSSPNLALAIISIIVAGLSLTVPGIRGPYTKLMATLALINAAILLASVFMAQHALLDQIRDLMWTVRPLRAIRVGAEKAWDVFTGLVIRSLRAGSVTFGVGLVVLHVLVSAGLVLLQWREQTSISADYIWAHTGSGTLHVGHALGTQPVSVPATATAPGLPALSFIWTKSPAALSQVVSLALPAGTTQLPTAQIEKINQQHGIPLLTWQVEENAQVNKRFQEQILQLIKHKNHLLLQPIIPATTPKRYRQAWQKMVASYRATGDTTAVWVWTPPRPDSLDTYFPGSIYLTWIIYDGRQEPAASPTWTKKYQAFRQQVAVQIAMQSKPVMLLVQPAGITDPYNWSQQNEDRYSEIKAVVFGTNDAAAYR